MNKNISKTIYKHINPKYSQKRLPHTKQSAEYALKSTSKRAICKAADATDNLIGNKISNKIRKISSTSPENSSRTVTNKQKILDLREKYQKEYIYTSRKNTANYWWSKINIII